jgi:hypothetical protein
LTTLWCCRSPKRKKTGKPFKKIKGRYKKTRRCNMGCGSCGPKKMAKYVCAKCGKEETREAKEGKVVKSCCGQTMVKKED